MVLGHELAHIRRIDLFWGLMAALFVPCFSFTAGLARLAAT